LSAKFLADKQFWAAILAAPIVWILLYFYTDALIAKQEFNPIYAIFIYPIIEELAFRGLIQDYLHTKFTSTVAQLSLANILTTILFVLLHLVYHPILWALAVFIPSLIFGYFKDRTGYILPAIILHIFYNSGFFLLL
jgi:membrane protease YdiL (CAAX protease family)